MRRGQIHVFLLLMLLSAFVSSCGVNSNLMFKEEKVDEIVKDSIPLKPAELYRISINDKISFHLTTKEGIAIIDNMIGVDERNTGNGNSSIEYTVRQNGKVKLPLVGEVTVEGLTILECEDTLKAIYSKYYQSPFIQVEVTNRRVIVFPGNGSDAKVIPLVNENTTLMEALAHAGGITDRGKASAVKLIRKVNGERVIYRIDLSTTEGLKYADMVVQANDYIYVEPKSELPKEVAQDIVPVVSIISSTVFILTTIVILK